MLSLKTAVAATVLTSMNVPQVEDFVNGLLTGLVQDDSLTKVQACLTDAESVKTDLQSVVADFQKKDIADMIAGVKVLGHLVSTVQSDIKDCQGMKDDEARIEKWSAIFNDKGQLVQTIMANAMANISGLKADIGMISTDITKSDFKDLGMDMADILTKTLGPVPQSALSAKAFPAFDMFHANCAMETMVSAKCSDVKAAFDKTVASPSWDPAGGLYAVQQETANSLWVTRTTPTKHYVDDIEFVLLDQAHMSKEGTVCKISAKSRSETKSYYDYDTNFCNMYNVFKSSGVAYTTLTTSECKWVPTAADLEATCNKY